MYDLSFARHEGDCATDDRRRRLIGTGPAGAITAVDLIAPEERYCREMLVVRETVRRCERIFSTSVRLIERHWDYQFSCGQPQFYAYIEEHFA